MAWNDNPQVRDLAKWAKKFGYNRVVAIVFTDAQFGYVSYGKTARLCDEAKKIGDQIYDKIRNNIFFIEFPDNQIEDSNGKEA